MKKMKKSTTRFVAITANGVQLVIAPLMIKRVALILAAVLMASCFPMESRPQQQTTTTTTTTCPPGTQLGSDGICR